MMSITMRAINLARCSIADLRFMPNIELDGMHDRWSPSVTPMMRRLTAGAGADAPTS
jgi:hypothetical protein